jgi:hypothetical protein
MTTLQAHGISAQLPSGFEGRIFQRSATGGEVARPVAHFATFALPADVADFGGGAVPLMTPQDIFSVLFEYGPESLGTALFAQNGMPRQLTPQNFSTITLRRGMPSQSGTQFFFTENGRPFTLYVVLGSHTMRASLVPRVNALLGNIDVSQVGSTVP